MLCSALNNHEQYLSLFGRPSHFHICYAMLFDKFYVFLIDQPPNNKRMACGYNYNIVHFVPCYLKIVCYVYILKDLFKVL